MAAQYKIAKPAVKEPKGHAVRPLNNLLIMAIISVFQIMTGLTMVFHGEETNLQFAQIMAAFIVVEWCYVLIFMGALHRKNFELEFIAFFLCGTGLVAIASVNPKLVLNQFIAILIGMVIYIVMMFMLGNLEFCMKLRVPAAVCAVGLLAVNLLIAKTTHGARNWIDLGFITIQPSELVKVVFIFVGASTLEKIQTSKNMWAYLFFACTCVGSLFLMKDFGTALIFFFTFLIIAFMNSGDIRTIIYSCTAGILGALMIIKFKPHVTSRFKAYRHVWEYSTEAGGYQQTRVLIGMASGGLFGVGIGSGYIKNVFAASNDLIFGVICEEWGFLFGVLLVLSLVAILVSALLNSTASRSTFYSIAACAGAGLLLFQGCLNIFGITDILPLTGVTLPFVSQGGSSMMCCWGILALIKASDVRTYNYLGGVVKK